RRDGTVAAGTPRRRTGRPGRGVQSLPAAPPPDGALSDGPPPGRARRCFRRASGSLPRCRPPDPGLPQPAARRAVRLAAGAHLETPVETPAASPEGPVPAGRSRIVLTGGILGGPGRESAGVGDEPQPDPPAGRTPAARPACPGPAPTRGPGGHPDAPVRRPGQRR